MITAAQLADHEAVRGLVAAICRAAERVPRPVTFMEVCGTHTNAIAAAGLRRLLPPELRLISGPGCPVCVTEVSVLDRAEALAATLDVTLCTFGDLLRVPSSTGSLERARAKGADIRVVYSPRDAVTIARNEPQRRVVFVGVGFETTVPTVAAALAEAEETGVRNFLCLSAHKTMPAPLRALAGDEDVAVDGFICPGHVSVITGWRAFAFLPEEFGIPAAVAGFSPTDVLRAVLSLVRQCVDGRATVENVYSRVVSEGGNQTAQRLVERFFAPADATWRGLGVIPGSGLELRPEYGHRDAARLEVSLPLPREPQGCRCGDILKGCLDPPACPLFATACTPDTPVGACMVSAEGACAAWYRHEHLAERS